MNNAALAVPLQQAVKKGKVRIRFPSNRKAQNFRQKMYRFRDQLRNSTHALALLADDFKFKIDGTFLIVAYEPPPWEKIDDFTKTNAQDNRG